MMIFILIAILSVLPNESHCTFNNNTVLVDNQTVTGELTKSIILNCPIISNESNFDVIIWKYDNSKVVISLRNPKDLKDTLKIRGNYNGSLMIDNLEYNDAKIYTCSVYKSAELFRVNIKLTVHGPPLNFNNFTYEAVSENIIIFHWEINITTTNGVNNYNLTLCESLINMVCQVILVDHKKFTHTFDNLKSFTEYHASISAINRFGHNKVIFLKAKTHPGTPLPVLFVRVKFINERNVTLSIECNECLNNEQMRGVFQAFVITYRYESENFTVDVKTNTIVTEKTIVNLRPYTNYTFYVAAFNGAKFGNYFSIGCQTKEDYPNSSTNLVTTEIMANEIHINWSLASDQFGPITGYILQIQDASYQYNMTINLGNKVTQYHFKDLKPRHYYTIRLAAQNKAGMSIFTEIMQHTDRLPPSSPKINDAKIIGKIVRVFWTNVFHPTETSPRSYEICWTAVIGYFYKKDCMNLSLSNTGRIKCSCDVNSTIHSVDISKNRFNLNVSHITFWVTAMIDSDVCRYGGHCPTLATRSVGFKYELKDDVKFNDDSRGNIPHLSIVVATIGCIIFLTCFFVFFCFCGNKNIKEIFLTRRSHNNYLRPGAEYIEIYPGDVVQPQIIPLEKTPHRPIEVKDLVDHIMHYRCDDGAGFQNEFEAIEVMDTSHWNITIPNRKENKSKNRYTNIFPYDHSRVVLQNSANGKSDYVNASFIDGYNRRNAYIATQGPLMETICDFWQMVYEQNSEIIVMITNFDERGRRKCEVYWVPNKVVCYGNISVSQIYEKKMAFYTERRFAIKNIRNKKNSNKERTVYHYQYTDWRDFDVPPSSLPVLVFVRATTKHWSMSSGPIVVHCSAGVGRTGTYICIESQIRQMCHEHKINVRGFLEHIRQQRMKLVQTESQYTFIHDALYEYFLCPDHDIRKDFFSAYIFQLKYAECIGFIKQFQMCTQFEPTNYEYTECKRSYNVHKNRSKILPVESRRINLSCEPGIEGSNYINASAIQGYWDMKEFIITQHPLEETEPDFWKMIWDENCTIIILLSDESVPQFWPAYENDFRSYHWSQVNYCSHEVSGNISKHGFLLSSQREDFNLNCTMYRLKQWPSSISDTMDLLQLLFTVNSDRVPAPIVVVDDFGGSRAGIFVALSSLLHQLRNDDIVDVYFVMKMIHMERPNTFNSKEDLQFIYEVMELVIANQQSYPFFTTPVTLDFAVPNGICHQNNNSSATTKPSLANGSIIPRYATLNTIRSRSSSSSATFRRRPSSAEAEPFCHSSTTGHNRISWNPYETTRFSLMDWSMSNGNYNGGLMSCSEKNGVDNDCGTAPTTLQIITNPISASELPVARIVPIDSGEESRRLSQGTNHNNNSLGNGVHVTISLGDNATFDSSIASSDL